MVTIKKTVIFTKWLDGLKDMHGRAKILTRLQRFSEGNFGDVKPVGDGVSEIRVNYGPGYRSYYWYMEEDVVILLNGGDKKTQARDIKKAKSLAKQLKEEKS